ncbi:WXG100 family type VII secretion target [Nocardia nova]|uniref:WXG100 family type VII secretion target n=1 Tax=Nocardia nova TaxID=37330 RepID=UPI002738E180|nr:WXG100 family type VII secretion target [Nocardia nova]
MSSSENTGKGPVRDGGYSVDLEHLDAVVSKIGGLVGFITDSLEGLDQRLAAAHQSWAGQAADSHIAAHAKWAAAAQEAREGIDIMRAAAATAHNQYSDAVATNLQMLRR